MDRRTFVVRLGQGSIAWTVGAALPARVLAAEETRFQGATLRVATWGGATRDALRDYVASEIDKRGGKVEFVIGSPQDNFAKLIAARGQAPFDLFEFLGTMVPEVTGRDLLAKLDLAKMPNLKQLKAGSYNEYMVPTWNTEEMIIYNKDKFRENGLTPPQSLTDLRNPKLAGRIMIPDISSGGGIEAVGAFALTAGGDEKNIAPGLKLISELPNPRFWKAGGEVVTQFKSGDIWVAVAHAGWAVRTANAGVPVATVPARMGNHVGMIKEGYIGLIKGSKNQELAEFFINTYLSPEAQYEFSQKVAAVPVNPQARAKMGNSEVIRNLVVLDQAAIDKMAKLDPSKINLSQWNEQWNRMVAR
ncbi:MAG TPA: extracellular solute-binding protein [Casimicrobiaceae bacterium]|nr:extracellular solute-binding protein [Casimicrobiaceae bacterium]